MTPTPEQLKIEDQTLHCPDEYETATGYFEPSDAINPGELNEHCAGCGCDWSEHVKGDPLPPHGECTCCESEDEE